jgi:hypothetical protein
MPLPLCVDVPSLSFTSVYLALVANLLHQLYCYIPQLPSPRPVLFASCRGKFVAIAAEKGQKLLPDASAGFKERWHVGECCCSLAKEGICCAQICNPQGEVYPPPPPADEQPDVSKVHIVEAYMPASTGTAMAVTQGVQHILMRGLHIQCQLLSARPVYLTAGDTPMDIKAALEAGAHALGVTTGIFSRQELLEAVPPGGMMVGSLRGYDHSVICVELWCSGGEVSPWLWW